jgi:hypothetical protein
MSAKAVAAFCNEEFTPAEVHFVPGLLEEIGRLVQDGYAATSHGGLEIGGLLFGRHSSSGSVAVEDFRPLPCDHSLGPRFILSERDEQGLRDLLNAPATDPALRGLHVIGWYCSHTRSELLLSDREVVLHDTYFSDPFDFVIVFKPRNVRSVAAGIFLRGADGMIDPQCPATILEIAELSAARDVNRATPRHGDDLRGCGSYPVPRIVTERALVPSRFSRPIEPAASEQSIGECSVVIGHASTKSAQHSRKAGKSKFFLAAAGAITLLCLGAWRYVQHAQVPPANVFLSLRPNAGNLLLSWRSNVARPQRARVDIFDGSSSHHLNITDIFQPSGVLLFPHNTGNVQAVLTIETGNGLLVRHTAFTNPSALVKDPVVSEKNSEATAPTNLAPLTPATHRPRRRYVRRSHRKRSIPANTSPATKHIQANQSP